VELDTKRRDQLARDIVRRLEAAVPGSGAWLRGSLAEGRADAYSDIDLSWEVPDEESPVAVAGVAEPLSAIAPIRSLRADPDFQRSDRRRLLFVLFEGVPLFWRLDLDLLARSLGGDCGYDVGNPAARGTDWSLSHSALMNAVAATKALLRGQHENAAGLLARAFARVGLAMPICDPGRQIIALGEGIRRMHPEVEELAVEVLALSQQAFGLDASNR